MVNKITPANLDWSSPDSLRAVDFQDVYHSQQGRVAEAEHVFFSGNQLAARWQSMSPHQSFVIGETGFGTGLNFLVTLNAWRTARAQGQLPEGARLQYIAVEKHPLTQADMKRVWQQWPEFDGLSDVLVAQYPDLMPGFHRLHFNEVDLTLIFDDATRGLNQLVGLVDCWYLDGFSPASNPDMWQQPLFEALAAHSHATTTLSTFTVAQQVKEGLSRAGFAVEKVPGFGLKRHNLSARYRTNGPALPAHSKPWFHYLSEPASPDHTIAVIGAGIAGASTAAALIRRGYAVDVIEKQDFSAGPPPITIQGVLYVKLSASYNPHSAFYAQGFLYSAQQLRQMPEVEWDPCGVIQTAFNSTEFKRQQKFLQDHPYPSSLIQGIDADKASQVTGVPLSQSGLYFPQGGWINPVSLVSNLMAGARLLDNTEAQAAKQEASGWFVMDQKGQRHGPYSQIVLACSTTARNFEQMRHLPTQVIRGQKTFIAQPKDQPLPLKSVLCGSVYIAPASEQSFNFGATFQKNDPEPEARDSDNDDNKQQLRSQFPALQPWLDLPGAFGLVGFRCTSPDYMPMVGAVPDWAALGERYADCYRFKKQVPPAPLPLTGLYCNIAHGSRGLASAQLSGEIIASLIQGDPLPVSRQVADHLNPARFFMKNLLSGKV